MSVTEFFDMLGAFVEEEQRQDDMLNQRVAWQTAHLMNATGNFKKKIKVEDLYKPRDSQTEETPKQNIVKKFESKEAKEDYLKNLMKKFGK
jgi:allantoicase